RGLVCRGVPARVLGRGSLAAARSPARARERHSPRGRGVRSDGIARVRGPTGSQPRRAAASSPAKGGPPGARAVFGVPVGSRRRKSVSAEENGNGVGATALIEAPAPETTAPAAAAVEAKASPDSDAGLETWTVPLAQVDAEGSPFRFRRTLKPDAKIKEL